MTDIYPLGTTCASKGSATAVYSANYDPWGNQTTRTTGGVTGTLTYDQSNQLTAWNAGANSQEFYLYDATDNRILKRSITGTGTTLAVYSFGLEENDYSGTGVLSTQTHYYNLASHLIGSSNGTTTTFYMTDGLDSVLTAFGQSAIEGEQVYGPFGASSYQSGLINTAKGYTGQVHDGVSGLDYYVARYYDPVMGMFLSADTVQGNLQGIDPYAYAGNNPESRNDPSGHYTRLGPEAGSSSPTPALLKEWCLLSTSCDEKLTAYNRAVAWQEFLNAVSTGVAVGEFLGGLADLVMSGDPSIDQAAAQQAEEAATADAEQQILKNDIANGGACSFTSGTQVETAQGKQTIGSVYPGEKVLAYNPQTHKMEFQPILHVWIHQDDDLVDLTITSPVQSSKSEGKEGVAQTSEVVHTNKKHPFLTIEKGFLPVGQIKVGMHVLRADGQVGVITKWVLVPGVATMYNLEVAQDHTFTVGADEWIVHNCTKLGDGQFDSQMIADYMSGDGLGKSLEGQTGVFLRDEVGVDVVGYDQQYYGPGTTPGTRGNPIGQVDIETPNTIIEVKSGEDWQSKYNTQVSKLQTNTTINPTGKAVVVFAPGLNEAGIADAQSGCGCTVLTSSQQLIEYQNTVGF